MADSTINGETFINNVLAETIDTIVNGHSRLPADQQNKLKAVPFSDSNFVTLCSPPMAVTALDFAWLKGLRQPIDYAQWKDLSDADKEAKKGDQAYALTVAMDNFSVLVDTVPNKSGVIDSVQVWEPQNRISQVYESFIRFCEVADTEPTPDAEERIKRIRSALVQTVEKQDPDTLAKFTEERPSALVAAYNKYLQEYSTAYSQYVDLMAKATTGNVSDIQKASMLGPQYYNAVTAAYDMWESSGHKSEYEKMIADLTQLEGVSMSLLLKEYREIFRRSQRTSLIDGLNYNVCRLIPADFFNSKWPRYNFDSSTLKKTDSSILHRYAGGARWGIMVGGNGGYKQHEAANQMSFEGFSMSFELMQAVIVRSWCMDPLFASNKIRLKSQPEAGSLLNPGDVLSNGNLEHPDGPLFGMPTAMFFARDTRVSKQMYDKIQSVVGKDTHGSGGLSIGPFSIGGSASYNKETRDMQVHQEGSEIVAPGTYILGLRNRILHSNTPPYTVPNPDPKIKKWI